MTDVIKTERLILRPIRRDDAQAIVSGVGDLEVSRWLTHPPHPYSLADAHEFIDKNLTNFPGAAVIEKDGAFAGMSAIGNELGYWLSKPMWGQGIAMEASEGLLEHLFNQTDAETVGSGYFIGNHRSRKILENLNFSNVAVEKITPISTGIEVNLQKMSLSRARWMASR